MKRTAWIVSAIVAAIVGAALLLRPARTIRNEALLPARGHLSPIARGVLRNRMLRHGEAMMELERAVILLDDATARTLAARLADEPLIARATTDDATQLNSMLPARFFKLQDDFRAAVGKLAQAAAGGDTAQIADAHAELSRVCVSCHRVYLFDPAPGQPSERLR